MSLWCHFLSLVLVLQHLQTSESSEGITLNFFTAVRRADWKEWAVTEAGEIIKDKNYNKRNMQSTYSIQNLNGNRSVTNVNCFKSNMKLT